MQTEFYEQTVEVRVPMKVEMSSPLGANEVEFEVHFQTCNDRTCLPPATVHLTANAEIVQGATVAAPAALAPRKVVGATVEKSTVPPTGGAVAPTRAATPTQLPGVALGKSPAPAKATSEKPVDLTSQGFASFLWLAIGMGALSLLTPCVFPMIPITVSYFANHAAESRRGSIAKAGVYAAGIILTFSAVGMLLAVVFGAGGVNRLASNPWVNLGITAVFLTFAMSLFGAFFIQVPSGLTRRLDALSRTKESSGTVGALLMGVLFTLTSFTCTAPFIGTLLVMATQGNWRWPMAGMLAFSTVFAVPFFVLALVPQIVSSLPRAGGWMNSVKVVMGFLEIAAAMKFLSNADLVFGWGIFTRQAVLCIWVAVSVLTVLYVLGNFRMSHDSPVTTTTAPRIVFAIFFLSIGTWLFTGLFGHSLGELEAFLPPPAQASTLNSATGDGSASSPTETHWILNDLDAAKREAIAQNKPIFIDFTGYTCTNCRWMEANMFPRSEIQAAMNQFVLVRLYTDGDGSRFAEQQKWQNDHFGTVALPLYVVLAKDGSTVATFPGLTRNTAEFLSFLQRGRSN
jgi:thiol:disulfide interchange protein DsbD